MKNDIKFNAEKTVLGGHISKKKGVILLTDEYIQFSAFTSETINYSDVKNVTRYKIFGFMNTGVKITTTDNVDHTFSIIKAGKFIEEINSRIEHINA